MTGSHRGSGARHDLTLTVTRATERDAEAIAALRNAVAQHQTATYGAGHWTSSVTQRGVATALRTSHVLVARSSGTLVATLRLATKKPWAIDRAYFSDVLRPLYLTDMAVIPLWQRRGVGRYLLEEAKGVARAWPADAIRLDAYDIPDAGAGPFYAKCGFREVGRKTYRGVPLVYFELILPGI